MVVCFKRTHLGLSFSFGARKLDIIGMLASVVVVFSCLVAMSLGGEW